MPIALADNALISIEEYRFSTGAIEETAFNEDELSWHINTVSQKIANYLDRVVCPTQEITEIFDGDGTKDQYVRHQRLNAAPTLSWWDGTQWVEWASGTYYWTYDEERGRIYFQRGNKFYEGEDNYKLVYTTGYAVDDVPAPIKDACCQWITRSKLKAGKGKEGLTTEAVGEASTSYALVAMPQDIIDALQIYRHISVGG